MYRFIAVFSLVVFLLSGCSSGSESLAPGMQLRENLLGGNGCKFVAEVQADFGDLEYSFSALCETSKDGSLHFCVLTPELIAGIEGVIDHESGKLTFDDMVLSFPLLADGELSPVSGPWVFYKALIGGYLYAAGKEERHTRLTIKDSFHSENFTVEVWLSGEKPVYTEIIWRERKILSLSITDFEIL